MRQSGSPPRAVALLSGGLDSAVALAIARAEGFACHALTFDYGQRHRVELECARAVARALGAERHTVELGKQEEINDHAARYLNRLSDFLFVFARWVNHRADAPETQWVPVDRGARAEERKSGRKEGAG